MMTLCIFILLVGLCVAFEDFREKEVSLIAALLHTTLICIFLFLHGQSYYILLLELLLIIVLWYLERLNINGLDIAYLILSIMVCGLLDIPNWTKCIFIELTILSILWYNKDEKVPFAGIVAILVSFWITCYCIIM